MAADASAATVIHLRIGLIIALFTVTSSGLLQTSKRGQKIIFGCYRKYGISILPATARPLLSGADVLVQEAPAKFPSAVEAIIGKPCSISFSSMRFLVSGPSANRELILLYWDIGENIVEAQKLKGYAAGITRHPQGLVSPEPLCNRH